MVQWLELSDCTAAGSGSNLSQLTTVVLKQILHPIGMVNDKI